MPQKDEVSFETDNYRKKTVLLKISPSFDHGQMDCLICQVNSFLGIVSDRRGCQPMAMATIPQPPTSVCKLILLPSNEQLNLAMNN